MVKKSSKKSGLGGFAIGLGLGFMVGVPIAIMIFFPSKVQDQQAYKPTYETISQRVDNVKFKW